jgi:hypothetical protein
MSLIQQAGAFREELRYSFDYEYFQRILLAGFRPIQLEAAVAMFRVHEASKTASHAAGFAVDDQAVADLYFSRVSAQHQRRLTRQRHQSMAWRTVDRCTAIAQTRGFQVARNALWLNVLRDPRLLQYRPVWGALRRWYGWSR